MVRVCIPVFVCCLLAVSAVQGQTTFNVPSAPYPTIQSAINAAQSGNGDTVLVAPGTYTEAINFLGKAVTVVSAQGADVTTIFGTPAIPIVTFDSGELSTSVLDGFRITGGGAGGILCQDSSPFVTNCLIIGNFSTTDTSGAGVRCLVTASATGAPIIDHCEIIGNMSDRAGGGIYCETGDQSSASMTIQNCLIANNASTALASSSPRGGGGASFRNTGLNSSMIITVSDCTISGNSAMERGGGLHFSATTVATLTNCRILDNAAGDGLGGGGIYGTSNQLTLTNCLIARNVAVFGGGGAVIASSSNSPNVSIVNCTVANNVAPGVGGIYLLAPVTATMSGSIIWGNTGLGIGGLGHGGQNFSLTVSFSDVESGLYSANPTNLIADPLFVDPLNGDYHLASSSPCVDAGNPGAFGLPATDIDGTPRVVGGIVDMGADELPATSLPGSSEDLDLYTWIGGLGDPHAELKTAAAWDLLSVSFVSPGGTFDGAWPLLIGQVYATGSPPIPIPGLLEMHVDLLSPFTFLYGSLTPVLFPSPGLPAAGVDLSILVPPGLSGTSVRLQGFVVVPLAANGLYAATRAHDIDL